MNLFNTSLITATFLCSLVAGFLFAYAVVVMPGLKKLNDKDFIRAFQVTDGIIQNNQPLFILMWLGSIIALILATIQGAEVLDGADLYLLLLAATLYFVGVQALTVVVNLPLNNQLQKHHVDVMNDAELATARQEFESSWNRFNVIRAAVACGVSLLLITLLLRQ